MTAAELHEWYCPQFYISYSRDFLKVTRITNPTFFLTIILLNYALLFIFNNTIFIPKFRINKIFTFRINLSLQPFRLYIKKLCSGGTAQRFRD